MGHGLITPAATPRKIGSPISAGSSTGLRNRRMVVIAKARKQNQRGNESQKPCPFEKTAEKIAAVAGVSPRTIKNDAHFAEAIELFRRSVLHDRLCLAVGVLIAEARFFSGDLICAFA